MIYEVLRGKEVRPISKNTGYTMDIFLVGFVVCRLLLTSLPANNSDHTSHCGVPIFYQPPYTLHC